MKNVIQLGAGILLVAVLLTKKKEVGNSDQSDESPLMGDVIPIVVPATIDVVNNRMGVSEMNKALSPFLTNIEVSDTERLINALNSLQMPQGTLNDLPNDVVPIK